MNKAFAASLLRRVNDSYISKFKLDEIREMSRKDERAKVEREMDPKAPGLRDELFELKRQIDDFEAASGMKLTKWDCGRLRGEEFSIAAKLNRLGSENVLSILRYPREQLARALQEYDDVIAGLKKYKPE